MFTALVAFSNLHFLPGSLKPNTSWYCSYEIHFRRVGNSLEENKQIPKFMLSKSTQRNKESKFMHRKWMDLHKLSLFKHEL